MIAKRIQFYVEMPRWNTLLLAFVLLALALPAAAQQATPSSGPPPPPAQQVSPATGPPPPPPPPEEPVFDPYHAQKSIEIGKFYLDKGDYDAAIGRFEDATRYQPKLALPWELLGEAWEKKHDKEKALDAYKKFLELLPQGGDSDRVRKRVAKLQDDLAREARKAQ
ncbi:MAG: tetratricopeptide repeat protein [Candidatus Acidiferrales bacterium]